MKKLKMFLATVLLCLTAVSAVWADEPGEKPDYHTDYYMIVESKAGGIDIHASAAENAPKINEELIPNGTALHIEGEKETESKRVWGYVKYHGMYGYVPLDDCRPAGRSEAVKSELSISETEEVNYDVEVSPKENQAFLYYGPGEKFGQISKIGEIPNGEKLSISQETESEDTGRWGLTQYQGTEGWINLEDTKKWEEKELPADVVKMTETGAASASASTGAIKQTPTAAPAKAAEITPTAAPTKAAEITPTAALTKAAEITPTAVPTKEAEITPTAEPTKAAENSEDSQDTKETSANTVSKESSWLSSPFVWIGVLSLLAVLLLLIYHFKKR